MRLCTQCRECTNTSTGTLTITYVYPTFEVKPQYSMFQMSSLEAFLWLGHPLVCLSDRQSCVDDCIELRPTLSQILKYKPVEFFVLYIRIITYVQQVKTIVHIL